MFQLFIIFTYIETSLNHILSSWQQLFRVNVLQKGFIKQELFTDEDISD